MWFSSPRWLEFNPHLSKYDHPIQNNSRLIKSNNHSSSLSQSSLDEGMVQKKNTSEDAGEANNQNAGERNRLVNATMNDSQIVKDDAGIGTMSHQNHRLQTVRMRVLCRNMICTVKK